MAATITVHVYTGASGQTISGSVTGIDLISADNATNSLANRIAYPISACSVSYEKWLSACVTSAPTNNVSNFLVWGDEAVMADTILYYGVAAAASTPVNTVSGTATTAWTTTSSTSKATWDSASYAAAGSTTAFLVFQLRVETAACAGNWTQETVNYSYDET